MKETNHRFSFRNKFRDIRWQSRIKNFLRFHFSVGTEFFTHFGSVLVTALLFNLTSNGIFHSEKNASPLLECIKRTKKELMARNSTSILTGSWGENILAENILSAICGRPVLRIFVIITSVTRRSKLPTYLNKEQKFRFIFEAFFQDFRSHEQPQNHLTWEIFQPYVRKSRTGVVAAKFGKWEIFWHVNLLNKTPLKTENVKGIFSLLTNSGANGKWGRRNQIPIEYLQDGGRGIWVIDRLKENRKWGQNFFH